MLKKAKVVMLPTNEKAHIGDIVKSSISSNLSTYDTDKIHAESKMLIKWEHQHLYITSDEEIKEGEILPYLMKWANGYELFNSNNSIAYSRLNRAKRIIASTNPTLNLPQPSEAFIQNILKNIIKVILLLILWLSMRLILC